MYPGTRVSVVVGTGTAIATGILLVDTVQEQIHIVLLQ
jgi:hypothetical protein